jgi:hypothetical protein
MSGALLSVGSVTTGAGVARASPTTVAAPITTTCSNQYLDGDARLGPQHLPTAGEIAQLVQGYKLLAGLSAQKFLATYWDAGANGGAGGWRYPPDNGFLISNGHPVEYQLSLGVGQDIDRFGSVFGAFLAPEGTPYQQRALPPMSLDNFDPAFPCNYHEYQVVKSFLVDSGPIAPGFGQPGFGRQYQLDSSLVRGSPTPLNVQWLVLNGYLAAVA